MRVIQLELTNMCQLKCVECPNHLMTRSREVMKPAVLDNLVENYIMGKGIETVVLSKDGEPLLYPNIKEAIQKICEVSRCRVEIYTNGLALNKQFVDYLTQFNNQFFVYLTFHRYDYLGNREERCLGVCEELKRIIKSEPDNVQIVVVVHATDYEDKGDLETWELYWNKKVRQYMCLHAAHVNYNINPWPRRQIRAVHNTDPKACPYTEGSHIFVGVTGNVTACCGDIDEEIILGNIVVDDPETIESNRYDFYYKMRNDVYSEELCQICIGKKEV